MVTTPVSAPRIPFTLDGKMKIPLITISALCLLGCERSIQNDYVSWRELEKEYKESRTVRGNIWPEIAYSLNSKEHNALLSYGEESREFIIQKFIEHRIKESDGYYWDSFFAYDIIELESLEADVSKMTPNDVAEYVYKHLTPKEFNRSD